MDWRQRLDPLRESTKAAVDLARSATHRGKTVALALAGGGSQASFQLGALRYLYDETSFEPSIITGTSAGSILGSVLGQYAGREDQRAALGQVEEIWTSMTSSADMYTELDWFAKLRSNLPTWTRVAAMGTDEHKPLRSQSWTEAMETLGTLWEGARGATDLQDIVRGVNSQTSAFLPGPIVDRLMEPDVLDADRLANSGVRTRICAIALESGQQRFITGSGEIHDAADVPIGVTVDVIDAITASCAIPLVFAPVKLGDEHYVDGGIRTNLPTEMAYTLGADDVIAIVSTPAGPSPVPTFAGGDLLEVIMRVATEIMPDELQRLQIQLARERGAMIIEPRIEVHDALTVEPGLIAIYMAYGWMRARDVMTGADEVVAQHTHDIIELRRNIWALENKLLTSAVAGSRFGAAKPVVSPADLATLSGLKGHLRELIESAPAGHLPAGAERWWQGWEAHTRGVELPSW